MCEFSRPSFDWPPARFNQLLQAGLVNGFASMGNEGLDDADSNPNND